MASPPITELNDRAREIFRLVVETYLDSGTPVGSRAIAEMRRLDLSPASIRGVMQELEEIGLLAAPHTSAGRMPTEIGLRLFVDGIMQTAELSTGERRAIERQLEEQGPVEEALSATTAILSGLSACAGLVSVPKREARLKQLHFVRLSNGQALAVLVGRGGQVENRVIDLPPGISDSTLVEVGNFVSARLEAMTLEQALSSLRDEIRDGRAAIDRAAEALIGQGLAAWTTDADDRPVLIVRGQANLLDEGAASDLDRVRQLLDELETKQDIARLLDNARTAEATKIFIGSENKLFSLSGSSVIASPYRDAEGQVVGVVGVIGPTRLNYARIVPMVDFTAQALSKMLQHETA